MDIRFYNTLSNQRERFEPVDDGVVRMYHCGPTVYDFAHIGNFRAFLLADLLRRFFEFVGDDVEQVMNITDVGHMTEDQVADGGGEDKMALAMQRLKDSKKGGEADVDDPNDPYQVADYFARAFVEDARLMGLKLAGDDPRWMPHATDNIANMIELIGKLIDSGHAYVADDGAVYYDVASFEDYGKLSGNLTTRLVAGAGGRIQEAHQKGKRNPADFLLWKPDASHIMKWDAPWGVGYPGWHIECSAMAMSTLGVDTLDIHTGGEDNIFPHHECEIAQSTGATGKPFANYWLHARHLMVEGEKMSKSKGNFFTVRDLLARGTDPSALRYELLRTHYRDNANFTAKGLGDSEKAVERLRAVAGRRDVADPDPPVRMGDTPVESAFAEALADDLNISAALGALFKWLHEVGEPGDADVAALKRINGVLGVLERREPEFEVEAAGLDDDAVEQRVEHIRRARAARDYATSDAIRDELQAAGIEVQITRDGVAWKRHARLD